MECKIPVNDFEKTRITKGGVEIPVMLNAEKRELPEYLQVGQAWKVFGKWLVAMGQSDQNEIEFPDGELRSGHVCIVLRGIGFTLYFYELIDEYTDEQYAIFDNIRLILDKVLVCNQVASYQLRWVLERFYEWKGNIFPKFFNQFDQKKIALWSEKIDKQIEKHSNKKYRYRKMDKEKYWEQIVNPKNQKELINIKGCYAKLLSILNTIKPDLPQENINIIDELITRCEHGYYLGFILEQTLKEMTKKHPRTSNKKRGIEYLRRRVKNFRKGREDRVYLAAKEAFGMGYDVREKLDRMFVVKNIEVGSSSSSSSSASCRYVSIKRIKDGLKRLVDE